MEIRLDKFGTVKAESDHIVDADSIDLDDCRTGLFGARLYAIGNEYGTLAIVQQSNGSDALDAAVDAGKLDCQQMSEEDYAEYYANGWDDSYILAGNASEPFWAEYLWIREIPSSEFDKIREILPVETED